MKASILNAMAKRRAPLAQRFPDDLIEALRRMAESLESAFDQRHNRFDPNDPRLVKALLAVLAAFLAFSLLAALLTGQP